MMIPGNAVINALDIKILMPYILSVKLNRKMFAIPITTLPPTIAMINEMIILPFVNSYNQADKKPYVASSTTMEIPVGKIGGIPVKTNANKGKIAPQIVPKYFPHTNPHIITGICIGKNIAPGYGTGITFITLGNKSPIAIQRPVIITFIMCSLILSSTSNFY